MGYRRGHSPIFLVAEGDTVQCVINELADNEKFGHHIIVDEADLGDYPEDERHYGPSGQVIDLDHLMIHGQEGSECPFLCLYHGAGLPEKGMSPTEFWQREDG